jgi:protein gp37
MINITVGRYWDEGAELVSGCTPCSPGCDHCWSAGIAHRFNNKSIFKMDTLTDFGGRFNGIIRIHPDRLKRFNTRKPKVFAIWNDLFHEDVPFDFINDVFLRMWHNDNTFLVLTKRPKQMLKFIKTECDDYAMGLFENLYLGLTVCNQQEADEKIPVFLQVPGKKFLSIEPMLGEINLPFNDEFEDQDGCYEDMRHHINAVILGGETGSAARPMHPDWVRLTRDQCAAAGVPFFFKGWGEWTPWGGLDCDFMQQFNCDEIEKQYKSTAMDHYLMYRVGRKKAGRLLDGRTHDDLPWITGGD